jgi:hypothetical protein
VVIDYEFEIEFAYLKNLSTLIIHSKSFDGFYFRKRTFKHLPLTQITELQLHSIYRIDNAAKCEVFKTNSLNIL